MPDTVHVTDNADRNRYEAHLAGELAGFAEYQLAEALIVFTHTEVDRVHEGKGIGSALARFALDDVRERGGRRVLALCPFIKDWMLRHTVKGSGTLPNRWNPTMPAGSGSRDTAPPASSALAWEAKRKVQPSSAQ